MNLQIDSNLVWPFLGLATVIVLPISYCFKQIFSKPPSILDSDADRFEMNEDFEYRQILASGWDPRTFYFRLTQKQLASKYAIKDLSETEYQSMIRAIASDKCKRVMKISSEKFLYELVVRNKTVNVIYVRNRFKITRVLSPKEMDEINDRTHAEIVGYHKLATN